MEKKELINFWETCDPVFSHIEINDYLGDFDTLTKSWENNFIAKDDFNDKVVVDYGIGGGFLGQYLFSAKNIKKYIGFDISVRQLAEASNNLNGLNRSLSSRPHYHYSPLCNKQIHWTRCMQGRPIWQLPPYTTNLYLPPAS